MVTAESNYRKAGFIVQELLRLGVRHFFVAPGSRSAPLSMVLLRIAKQHSGVQCHLHFDERSLGFAALGVAKACRKPVVVLTSSGTAVANLLPAIVEASQLEMPLIALTADRPARLINVGANQAIEQPGIFSHFVRTCLNLPEQKPEPFADVLFGVQVRSPGPVHLNVPFEEPLYSELRDVPDILLSDTSFHYADKPQKHERVSIEGADCLILAGSLTPEEASVVLTIAEENNIPIVADADSQLKQHAHPLVLSAGHYVIRTIAEQPPECLLQFGGRIVSKPVNQFIAKFSGDYRLVTQSSGVLDPTGNANQVQLDAPQWRDTFVFHLHKQSEFTDAVLTQNEKHDSMLQQCLGNMFSEYQCVAALSNLLPEAHDLFLGNSLAIRLYDQVAVTKKYSTRIYANRGASGIDGLLATSAGIQLENQQGMTVLLGDLSALYDLNSLYWFRHSKLNCVIVILNNDGGQIFSMLPAVNQTDVFAQAFEQPHGLDFKDFASGFGLKFQSVSSLDKFISTYETATEHAGTTVLEVRLPSDAFKTHHALIQKAMYG